MIKKVLRRILTKKQYERFSWFKQKLIRVFTQPLLFMIKLLPDSILLDIKERIDIVKKMDYGRLDIFLNVDSRIEHSTRLHSCKKEPETIDWIETFFKEGDIFFDIGANVGAYSLVASKFYNGKITVYAFEPGFPNFVQLCKNIFINGCQQGIIPLQIALSDKTIVDTFNYDNITPGGALHALGRPIDYKGDIFEPIFKQSVLSYRIDDLVKEFNVPIPNHIKIDVDGIEFRILKGAKETLSNSLVKSIILEVEEGDEEADQIIEFLAGKGFKFHSKHKYVYGGDTGPFSRTHSYIFHRKTIC